ncbi:hypothetical protein N7535_005192 [Penicillium sp. DV-2018c]|nr:hypothetical protein N7461_008771 [Penicillium sp. DV-2018c]KAJ5571532.1 hypothetical protein N7535_005192 [Penicillium sp. DV-2018c]
MTIGFGTLEVMPTDSIDGTSLPLENVAYAPGFYLNLISADRAEDAGIFLDGGPRTCTFVESGGTQICRLNRNQAFTYLMQWDQNTTDGIPEYSSTHTVNPVSHTPLIQDFEKLALSSHRPKLPPSEWELIRRPGHLSHQALYEACLGSRRISWTLESEVMLRGTGGGLLKVVVELQ